MIYHDISLLDTTVIVFTIATRLGRMRTRDSMIAQHQADNAEATDCGREQNYMRIGRCIQN